jgi:hypothetical protein
MPNHRDHSLCLFVLSLLNFKSSQNMEGNNLRKFFNAENYSETDIQISDNARSSSTLDDGAYKRTE